MQKNNNIEDLFIEDSLQKVSIHQSEQDNLDRVFDSLYNLENEPSSDENSVNKMYIKKIKQNAELKRKTNFNKLYNKTNKSIINEKNNFNDILSHSKCNTNLNTLNNTNSTNHKKFIKKDFADDFNNYSEDKQKHKKFGQKALRKILKQYLPKDYEISKEDIRLMIWENDENLDGYLNKNEFDKMYKRCVSDEKEQEAKRLFYLVLFLMFDKDNKKYIVEEDTLEILYIRYKADFEKVLRSIFGIASLGNLPDPENIQTIMKESLNYKEFIDRMNTLALKKRKDLSKRKKDYCSYIPEILNKDKFKSK